MSVLGFDPAQLAWIGLTALVAFVVRGVSGFGSSMVGIGSLSILLPPVQVVPAFLALELLTTLHLLPGVWRQVDWRSLRWLIAGAMVATPLGLLLLAWLDPNPMRLFVSLCLPGHDGGGQRPGVAGHRGPDARRRRALRPGMMLALGGYSAALIFNRLGFTDALGLTLAGGLVSALVAAPFSPLLSRYRGIFFAMLSLGHIEPNFGFWTTSGEFVFVAILAGWQSVAAVFVASTVLEVVRSFSSAYFPNTWQLVLGLFLLFVIRFLPKGIGSLWMRGNTR